MCVFLIMENLHSILRAFIQMHNFIEFFFSFVTLFFSLSFFNSYNYLGDSMKIFSMCNIVSLNWVFIMGREFIFFLTVFFFSKGVKSANGQIFTRLVWSRPVDFLSRVNWIACRTVSLYLQWCTFWRLFLITFFFLSLFFIRIVQLHD